MAHLFCRNTDGFKKWKSQQTLPLVVCAVTVIFCVFGVCVFGSTNICSYSSSVFMNRGNLVIYLSYFWIRPFAEYKRPMAFALKANQDYLPQNSDINKIRKLVNTTRTSSSGATRLLGGMGSSPPSCTSKCGTCVPCKPVRVTVPPDVPVTTEYYPQAWMCGCGNRLYKP